MTINKGKHVLFFIVILVSFSKGQDQVTDTSLIPDMPAFPGDPPPAGDPFDVPLVATNTNEEVLLGDTPAIDSVSDPISQPIASDVADVVTNEPITVTQRVVTDLPPMDGTTTSTEPGTGDIVTDPPGVIDTNLIESGPEVISVGDGGLATDNIPGNVAVDSTVPVTTVDSNFDINGTFDGRNDMLLLTGSKPTNDSLLAAANEASLAEEVTTSLPTQVPDVIDTVTEQQIPVEGEVTQNANDLVNLNTTDNIGTNIDAQNRQISITTPISDPSAVDQGIPSEVLNVPDVTDFPNLPEATDRMLEASTTETSQSTADMRADYEQATKEYETFLQENPNTTFTGPPAPPPQNEISSVLPPIDNTPVIPPGPIPPVPPPNQGLEPMVTQEMVSTVPTAIEDARPVVPREPVPPVLPPVEDSLPGQISPSEIETSFTTQSTLLTTREMTTRGIEMTVQPDISAGGTDTVTEVRSIPVSSTRSPETNTRRPTITRNRLRGISAAIPPPPPPPSDVYKTDFGENVNQKSKTFQYKPVIPEREASGGTNVVDIKTIPDRNSGTANAYPFAIDQQRNRPRETATRQRDRGMSLIQYQFNNRNTQRAGRRSEIRDNRTGTRARDLSQNQNSNSFDALLDKNKKFVARFDQPGMPFYQRASGGQSDNAFFYSQPINSKPFYQGQRSVEERAFSDSSDTMPPILVKEYNPRSSRQNTVPRTQSTSRPVAARFNPRNIGDSQPLRTNAQSFKNKMDNSYEMWYQIMGNEWEKNRNRYRQSEGSSSPNRRNMGVRVLNTFWSRSSSDSRNGRTPAKNNNIISSINQPSTEQRENPAKGSQFSNRRDNSFAFGPQNQGSQSRNVVSANEAQRPNQKANSFEFEPQLQRFQSSGPFRMKIKEYTITRDPNLVSTTEARLNLRVPTISRPLEPELRPNSFSQNNPPPINIGSDISELEFQTFITTTERPTTLPQPSVASGFRNRQRSVSTTDVRNRNLSRNRSSNDNLDLPPPPMISRRRRLNPSIEDGTPMNPPGNRLNELRPTTVIVPSIQSERNVPLVKSIPNAVPYVPEMRTPRRTDRRLSALPRPPAINVGSSSGGELSNVGNGQNPMPIRNAQPLQQTTPFSFTQAPELTPVPPLFSVNRTLVMKLQNDSVTKEELPPSVCHQCHYVSDVCYLSEAGICNRFVECHKNGDQVRAFEKECAIGNFWNPETLACQKSLYVNCPSDPCKNPAVKTHPFLGRCRYFWKCNRGMSEFELCSPNYRYDGITETCVPDLTCKDNDLPSELGPQQEKKPEKCIWTAVQGSLTSFTDGFRQQECAPGTRFDEVQCTCVRSNIQPPGEVCNPDTLIDFEGDEPAAFTDKSGHMNGMGKEGVILKDGTGFFFGRGKLSFWRYANVELGPLLAIQIRFFPYGYAKNPMGLVSNCNGSPIGSTVDIRLDTRTKKAAFKLSTNQQVNNVIKLPYEPFQWNTATYVYAGDTFTASINDKKETIPVEGSIPNRHPAIQVGGCNREDGFRGYADDIKIYNGCIPEEFEYIIFT